MQQFLAKLLDNIKTVCNKVKASTDGDGHIHAYSVVYNIVALHKILLLDYFVALHISSTDASNYTVNASVLDLEFFGI